MPRIPASRWSARVWCFDTGGLDLKPSSAMLIMKKDMGGAANVLALAMMVMDAKLPVRLRVLIPAVENAVAGNAFRPLDIFKSRKGPTVEIGNTDAEGRLVLADALAYADEDKPDILIDMGTLTGAARRRARSGFAAVLHQRRNARGRCRHLRGAGERSALAVAVMGAVRFMAPTRKSPTSTTRPPGRLRGLDHLCVVFAALRRAVDAPGCMSISTAGRRPPDRESPKAARCQAARAIYPVVEPALWVIASMRVFTPARPDLAARYLEGHVTAARFVDGVAMQVIAPVVPVSDAPSHQAEQISQALFGECVTIYDRDANGWAWGQLGNDGYVGWLPDAGLGAVSAAPTHKVTALRTFAFSGPSIKLPPVMTLPMGATLCVRTIENGFAVVDGAFVPVQHVGAVDAIDNDFVAVAERFHGTPYLWGGKSSLGIDCSGLVQVSLNACGIGCPRDSDMQRGGLGPVLSRYRR